MLARVTSASRGVEAVAVCFLHSYANPAHEIVAAANILRRADPQCSSRFSHEILREFRENERTSTTRSTPIVGPRVRALSDGARDLSRVATNSPARSQIMRSNGGTMSIGEARRQPVAMMESGPVAGMIGAGATRRLLGLEQVIGFDMGGTTAKTALITARRAADRGGLRHRHAGTGQPMQLPVVDIVEVGAGGGSIAWVDATGGLHVGPNSAGADPGPACYGRGGDRPAVTDADLVLGRLNGERFLDGGMRLDCAGAGRGAGQARRDARARRHDGGARRRGHRRRRTCRWRCAPCRSTSGIDPRDTAMIAFGGAGPLHAVAIAREIFDAEGHHAEAARQVFGARHADGVVAAGFRAHLDRQIGNARGGRGGACLRRTRRGRARRACAATPLPPTRMAFRFLADLRYVGQEHTLPIRSDGPAKLTADTSRVRALFHVEHEQRYGQAAVEEDLEIVNMRLVLTAPAPTRGPKRGWPNHGSRKLASPKRRATWSSTTREKPVDGPGSLAAGAAAGMRFPGPAVSRSRIRPSSSIPATR